MRLSQSIQILDPFTASEVDELSAVAGELNRVDAGRAECVDPNSPPAQTSRKRQQLLLRREARQGDSTALRPALQTLDLTHR